ncbi:hypothetical protein ADL19_14890 [Streptomyces purpurogeneiscleroticus]|nr:hypothetical protein ADL19_14890 [Streptomyces purpurogeneiscleroticus]
MIWLLLSDSLDVLDRVPDQERRWLSSGTRSGGWSSVGLTKAELIEIERLRIMSAMMPFDGTTKVMPQRDDVDRAVDVVGWLRFLSKGDDHSLQKAAVLLAKGAQDMAIKLAGKPGRRQRQTAYEIRTQVVGRIVMGLRDFAGLVPAADGLHFEQRYTA